MRIRLSMGQGFLVRHLHRLRNLNRDELSCSTYNGSQIVEFQLAAQADRIFTLSSHVADRLVVAGRPWAKITTLLHSAVGIEPSGPRVRRKSGELPPLLFIGRIIPSFGAWPNMIRASSGTLPYLAHDRAAAGGLHAAQERRVTVRGQGRGRARHCCEHAGFQLRLDGSFGRPVPRRASPGTSSKSAPSAVLRTHSVAAVERREETLSTSPVRPVFGRLIAGLPACG